MLTPSSTSPRGNSSSERATKTTSGVDSLVVLVVLHGLFGDHQPKVGGRRPRAEVADRQSRHVRRVMRLPLRGAGAARLQAQLEPGDRVDVPHQQPARRERRHALVPAPDGAEQLLVGRQRALPILASAHAAQQLPPRRQVVVGRKELRRAHLETADLHPIARPVGARRLRQEHALGRRSSSTRQRVPVPERAAVLPLERDDHVVAPAVHRELGVAVARLPRDQHPTRNPHGRVEQPVCHQHRGHAAVRVESRIRPVVQPPGDEHHQLAGQPVEQRRKRGGPAEPHAPPPAVCALPLGNARAHLVLQPPDVAEEHFLVFFFCEPVCAVSLCVHARGARAAHARGGVFYFPLALHASTPTAPTCGVHAPSEAVCGRARQ